MKLIKKFLIIFKIYRRFVGKRIYLVFLLTIGAALAEGFGIVLLLPLLSTLEGGGPPENSLGLMIYNILAIIGIENSLVGILVIIGIIFICKGLLTFAQEGYRGYLEAQLMRDLKAQLYDAYSEMDYLYYIKRNTGYFINIINDQTLRFYACFDYFIRFSSIVVMTMTYLTLAFMMTWRFALMAAGSGLLLLFLFQSLNEYVHRLSQLSSKEMGHLNKLLVQALQAFKYITSTHQISRLRDGIMQSIYKLTDLQFRQQVSMAFTQAIREPVSVIFIIVIILVQVLVLKEPIIPILVAILLFHRSMGSVVNIQSGWQALMNHIGGLEMVEEELNILRQNREASGTHQLTSFSDCIKLHNVSFSYNTGEEVLKLVNMQISVNTTVALVGESGAGKSTLIDLLTLLLKPTSGIISIDGVPAKEVELASWRKQLGYVSQETVVFDDTIANNISLWQGIAESDRDLMRSIQEAAKKAHIADFIENLPEGYHTFVGDRGIRLSGGQRQRLFIARELFKKPNLLILDEATSALDTESELCIQKSIDELKGKITVVIIAHRLSTIRSVDYVYVFGQGQIIEEGTYQDLRNRSKSSFRKMVDSQIM